MPKVLKQVIAPGTYMVQGEPVTFTVEDCHHYARQGREMVAAGLPVRIPLEHQSWASEPTHFADDDERKAKEVLFNRGFVSDCLLDESDDSVWHELNVPDEATACRLNTEIKYVSPRIVPSFTDGTGRTWDNAIVHVALTPKPVWHGQKPFGAVPLRPVALSLSEALAAGKEPVELSLEDRIELRDGMWHPAPAEVEMAVKWEAYHNPKTNKSGWKSSGGKGKGRVVYSAAPPGGGSKTSPAAPKAATAPVTTEPTAKTKPGKGEKPAKGGDDLAPGTQATHYPKMPEKPGKGDRDTLHQLRIPELKGIAQGGDLDQYAKELSISPANLSAAKGTYTKWQNAAAKAATKVDPKTGKADPAKATTEFLAKIQSSIAADNALMSKGKTRAPNGALLAARMVAYRHMLDWFDQDHPGGVTETKLPAGSSIKTDKGIAQNPERQAAREEIGHTEEKQRDAHAAVEYQEALKEPLKDRLDFIHEHRKVEVETKDKDGKTISKQAAQSGPQRFTNDVVRGLFALHGSKLKPHDKSISPEAWQAELDKYRAALEGGEAKINTGKTATNNETGKEEKTFRTVKVADPRRFIKTFNENVVKQIRAGEYADQLTPVLTKLSNVGHGTLSPEEFKNLVHGVTELSLPLDVPTRSTVFLRPTRFGLSTINTALVHPSPSASVPERQQFHWQMADYHARRNGEHKAAKNLSLSEGHAAAFVHHRAMHKVYADPTNIASHRKALDWRPLHGSVRYQVRGDGCGFDFSIDVDDRPAKAAIELSFDPVEDADWLRAWDASGRSYWFTARGQSRRRPPVELAWQAFQTKARGNRPAAQGAYNPETGKKLYGQQAAKALQRQSQVGKAQIQQYASTRGANKISPEQRKLIHGEHAKEVAGYAAQLAKANPNQARQQLAAAESDLAKGGGDEIDRVASHAFATAARKALGMPPAKVAAAPMRAAARTTKTAPSSGPAPQAGRAGAVNPYKADVNEYEHAAWNEAHQEGGANPHSPGTPEHRAFNKGLVARNAAAAPPAKVQAPAPDLKPLHSMIDSQLERATNLTPEQKQGYGTSIKKTIGSMTPAAQARIAQHVKGVAFFGDTKQLTDTLAKRSPTFAELAKQGKTAAGAYIHNKDGGGVMALDGGGRGTRGNALKANMDTDAGMREHIYAHELAHAVDGPKREHSTSPEWLKVHAKLKGSGLISDYADSSPTEQWAEFGRMVHTQGLTATALKRHAHPGVRAAAAYWDKHGFLPKQGKGGRPKKMANVFKEPVVDANVTGDVPLPDHELKAFRESLRGVVDRVAPAPPQATTTAAKPVSQPAKPEANPAVAAPAKSAPLSPALQAVKGLTTKALQASKTATDIPSHQAAERAHRDARDAHRKLGRHNSAKLHDTLMREHEAKIHRARAKNKGLFVRI